MTNTISFSERILLRSSLIQGLNGFIMTSQIEDVAKMMHRRFYAALVLLVFYCVLLSYSEASSLKTRADLNHAG